MSKLYFRYGAMNASKSANVLMVAFNYEEKGMNVLILKPAIDYRDDNKIKSRIGISRDCVMLNNNDSIYDILLKHKDIACILVDEAQFLTKKQVRELAEIVDIDNIPVICYGLRADFRGELFEGSRELLALADTIEEIKTICWCGKKAIMNTRLKDGKVVYEGEQVEIGGNEMYISLCRKHWREGKIKSNSEE